MRPPGESPSRSPAVALALGRRPGLLAALALAVAVAGTFFGALDNEFVYDDRLLIVDDPAVRMPLSAGLQGLHYRPLRTLSYRVDHALGGMHPAIFHFNNLVYHFAATLVVHRMLLLLGASQVAALAGGLVFAVHPVQADAVTYAAGRRDVLCGLFYVAGVVAWLRYRRTGRLAMLAVAISAYLLALLAKEMAFTLPLAGALAEWRMRRTPPSDRGAGLGGDVRGPALWLLVAGAVGVATLGLVYGVYLSRMLTDVPWHGGTLAANLATTARIWLKYLGLIVWPARLSADYSHDAFPVSASGADPRALAAGLVLLAIAWVAQRDWRRGGRVGLGLAWMALTVLPVSHLVPIRELVAEHYLYIPLMGVAIAVSGALDAALGRWPGRRVSVALVMAVVVVAGAARTIVRNRDWHDSLTLWRATVATVPRCARAQFNLGQASFERARLDDAERAWLTADAIKPEDPATLRALAALYYRTARYDLAAAKIDAALARDPNGRETVLLAGWIALDTGKPDRALAYFDRVLARSPPGDRADALFGRRRAAARLGLASPSADLGGKDVGRR